MSLCGAGASSPLPALIIKKRLPSGAMSKVRTGPSPAVDSSSLATPSSACCCARTMSLHADALDGAVGREVEQLVAAPRPHRRAAAARGHLPTARLHVGERTHVDLEAAGFVRFVRQPLSLGRQFSVPLVEHRLHQGRGGLTDIGEGGRSASGSRIRSSGRRLPTFFETGSRSRPA